VRGASKLVFFVPAVDETQRLKIERTTQQTPMPSALQKTNYRKQPEKMTEYFADLSGLLL